MSVSLLIVEDDEDQLEVLRNRFVRAGYRVVAVNHPRRALSALSFHEFEVALIDLSLPEMDGIELMSRLQRIQPEMNIILLSGACYPEAQAKADGAYAVLSKPSRLSRIESLVEEAAEHWQIPREDAVDSRVALR